MNISLPNWKWIEQMKQAPSKPLKFWKKILLSLGILLLMFIIQIIIGFIADKTGLYHPTDFKNRSETYLNNPIALIVGLIFAPIIEELIFRKLFFQFFVRKYHHPVIIASVSSFLFGLAHSGFILPYIISGLLLCYLTYKTQRIIYSMIVHLLFNSSLILIALSIGVS
ncbi:CPBP family intramembrane glutamic endopeptidase [Staphylococcus sp. RIT622]|uniref:CPBP family intramembrane glutamic endopeptidase n=1 Tax=Staphylococcus sp. RIT622 TaxID=2510795 RepID=UPI00101E5C85|nr:CPBP family intramembrane glutamic endopeptidase [Staphylococcus sp. RIT622]MCG2544243.1 CPBP family intramembrane metalloprotease [Staphylococcus epidermidis]RYL09515.1 CPBP family intramembrane metalloprotease [Staphylococcus sp. RIT622]